MVMESVPKATLLTSELILPAPKAMLRSALAGLIGADSEDELRQMEIAMRLLPAPDADKAVSINAIHALLATMTPNE